MGRDWLALDFPYLCWREFYSAGQLDAVRSIVGVLFALNEYRDRFATNEMVFAFDHPPYHRKTKFPDYKISRTDPVELAESRDELRSYINKCRGSYLCELGYGNIYSKVGYEADDILAAVALGIPPNDRVILVTEDGDLHQCLSNTCAIYKPRKDEFWTIKDFRRIYEIEPADWVKMKSLMGCDTDDIPGIRGVGEVTAIQYIKQNGVGPIRMRAEIERFMASPDYQRNLSLVTLPYPGLRPITPVVDPPRESTRMDQLLERLGLPAMDSGRRTVRSGGV
jgi:5'-3' exonuclease